MLTWDGALVLGIEEMDRQHKLMFELANLVCDANRTGARVELIRHVAELRKVTSEHFEFEESMMLNSRYACTLLHSEHHAEVLAQFERFCDQLVSEQHAAPTEKTMRFLSTWLVSHIDTFDRKLANHLLASAA